VVNPVTGQGIEGIEVQLQRETWGLPGGNKAIKSTFTDANGDFEISKLGLRTYTLRAQTGVDLYNIGWFENGENVTSTGGMLNVRSGKTMKVEYRAIKFGEIKIPIHNINCQGPDDTLIFTRKYTSFENISVFQPFTLTGCYNNNGAFAKVPSGNYLIEWTVIRSGVKNEFSQNLFVPGNGQASFTLNY
jgi:hypothetical protein